MGTQFRLSTCAALGLLLGATLPPDRGVLAAEIPEAYHAGAWAVELDKDMGRSYLSDHEISIKRLWSPTSATRLSLGVDYIGRNGTGDQTSFPPGTSGATANSSFSRNYTIRLDWVHHFALSEVFSAQLGVGPVAWFSHFSAGDADALGNYYYSSYRTNLVGGEVNLGAEWLFTKRLGLGGRVGAAALTGKQKYQQRSGGSTSGYRETLDSDLQRVFTDPARIILTGYF